MDDYAGDQTSVEAAGCEASFPDLTRVPLTELLRCESAPLKNAMSRLLREIDNPTDVLASFGSVLP